MAKMYEMVLKNPRPGDRHKMIVFANNEAGARLIAGENAGSEGCNAWFNALQSDVTQLFIASEKPRCVCVQRL